jgi:hypothetical protein
MATKNSNVFAVNERVSHSLYGLGTIAEIDQRHTIIEFDENGRRKFVTSIVQLEHSSIAAPEPPPKASRAKSAKSKAKK